MSAQSFIIDRDANEEFFSPAELRLIGAFLQQHHSLKAMARHLSLSVNTIQSHRYRMIQKIKGRNFQDVVLYCMKKGIIAPLVR